MSVVFVGAFYYARQVLDALIEAQPPVAIVTDTPGPGWQDLSGLGIPTIHDIRAVADIAPDLIITAGWRRLIPPALIERTPLGVTGFHSAKLPEYPGRAPVPWALLRGDGETANTLLYLDGGIDTGDIIDARAIAIADHETPDSLYAKMASTAVALLREHLPGLLSGSAPRHPQDMSRRGPLTTVDGWQRWAER